VSAGNWFFGGVRLLRILGSDEGGGGNGGG